MDRQGKQLLEFGPFRMDLEERVLMRDQETITLSPKTFETLLVLARHSERVVLKDDLMKTLWPDTFVEESNLSQHIFQLRKALGDKAHDPQYIVTVPGRGYRLALKVAELTEPDNGVIVHSRNIQRVTIEESETYQGREAISLSARSRKRPWGRALGAAVLAGIALIPGAIYWRSSHKVAALTERDTIVLADFTNKTGDNVFDDTLKQGLAIQLEQSPFLALVSDRKVNETLKLMGRPANDRLTPEVTHEICLRTGSKAALAGSIAELGNQYVIGLKATACSAGDVLAEAQGKAAGKEAVLQALDVAAANLRRKLGESLSSVGKYATPLAEASTPSLEALKAYSLGEKTRFAKSDSAALPFYRRALELDPNFALAHRAMSLVYFNRNEVGRSADSARKAFALRLKVSERERFTIEAFYAMHVTGEMEKAAQVYEQWQQTYPRDFLPHGNLGIIYGYYLGDWEKGLEETRKAMTLDPGVVNNYVNLGGIYGRLNRPDEAEQVYKRAAERNLEGEYLSLYRYQLAFLREDSESMARAASDAMGKPGTEDFLLGSQADTEAWHGNLRSARELTRRAMDAAQRNDAKEAAALYQIAAALREVESGNKEQALADADAAMKLAPDRDVRVIATLVHARAGDTASEKLAKEVAKTFPLDTLVQQYWLPTIRAAVALQSKDPKRAIEFLKVATSIELSQPTNLAVSLCPVYLRGEAYLMLHDGNLATAEFQKFTDHRGLVVNFSWGALARLGLARAHAQTGDLEKSRAGYREFLALWKNADPDLRILKEAKAEYAKLQ